MNRGIDSKSIFKVELESIPWFTILELLPLTIIFIKESRISDSEKKESLIAYPAQEQKGWEQNFELNTNQRDIPSPYALVSK